MGTGIGAQKPVERAAAYIKGCCQLRVFGHVLASWWDSMLSWFSKSVPWKHTTSAPSESPGDF